MTLSTGNLLTESTTAPDKCRNVSHDAHNMEAKTITINLFIIG